MGTRYRHIRLTDLDVTRLLAARSKLDAVYDSVNATGMSGKASIMAHLREIAESIDLVMVRETQGIQRALAAGSSGQGGGDPGQGGGPEGVSDG